jgi:hypothetical protein
MIEHPEDNNSSGTQNPAPRPLSTISIISFNARKRWETVSTVLNKYAGYVDIIMFQEPAWRGVCTQPSTTNRDGNVAHFFFFFFFLINVIYFKIELKGGLNHSLNFTSFIYKRKLHYANKS